MILIFGGVYQGKLDYALQRFGLTESDVYRCSEDSTATPVSKKILYEIDKWILASVKSQILPDLTQISKDAIIICNDVSCGIVPIDPVMRQWRETVGRALAVFARQSDEVIRLFCGIPSSVK